MGSQEMDANSIDFAVAVWHEEGQWMASSLPARVATSMDDLTSTLRQLPGEGGVFGLIGVVDEYFIVVRQAAGSSRAMISDGAAILDWALAEEAADVIGLDIDDDDLEDFEPVGDMNIFADFGLDADELGLLCRDEDLYPDQQIKAIAKRLGFSQQLKSVLRAN
ncbi:MAG: hypothetical protein F2675_00340 [Actinobacteria bacterium]|nr:hypothetical protein [Actinomycetota bacterium]MSW11028.1 hypothetical protein [Actinomycetota bacterium]MSX63348.1 hypothetical protein [Actinomycetota bacterium]MSY16337.1 hypothetical protein [Actinomycetota bacterium]MSY41995.1 hypothetical protein [Actinomycetota bacterium]